MSDYVELHAHSYFSLLDGASSPEELVSQTVKLGMNALALTDHDAVYGVVHFVEAARLAGIQPVVGAEMTMEDGSHLTLLVQNEQGWHNLCYLISCARRDVPKGESSLHYDVLRDHAGGLLALSGCRWGRIAHALLQGDPETAVDLAQEFRDWFGPGNFWIELQHHLLPGDDELIGQSVALAHQLNLGYVATNNVHYTTRELHRLQDILVCIRHNVTLEQAGPLRRDNSEYYFKSARKMSRLFAQYPEAITNTRHVANRCQFEPRYGLQDLPAFDVPPGMSAEDYLGALCTDALAERYPGTPDEVHRRLRHELTIIGRARLANYFLIVWDIVRFARENHILCHGRGSAANSLVAYVLGITPVDPLAHDLVFERFLSDERQLTPDIDIDFQADRREEVIQYVYQTYGHAHAAMACTFVTYRTRSALRDVGKALGLPYSEISQFIDDPDALANKPRNPVLRQLRQFSEQLRGFPRHLGIHNGGMIITGPALADRVPVEPGTMPNRYVVQWDKEGLETAGLVKIDLLGLRMLSLIAGAVALIERYTQSALDLSRLIFDDPAVYELIAQADTIGVFQVESRAQSQMQPIFKPTCFADLIIAISLIRPGPIQGDMVHPYIRRRLGEEPVTYPHPRLKPALEETLGVILFQEQVLKVARDLAGFTAGQGELLRRALSSKYATEALESLHDTFIDGALNQGVDLEVAEEVFGRLTAFGGYSFPKSHAAAFAVLVYQSAWLKRYHPAAFYVGLLNNQPMGFWSPAVIVNDAKRHGITMLPVAIVHSSARCTLENGCPRLGFNYVKGMGEASITRLVDERSSGPFTGLPDFCHRTHLPPRLVENLILSGAFDPWQIPRRKLLWELGKLRYQIDELDLMFADDGVMLPELTSAERFAVERSLLGVSIDGHPLDFFRDWLSQQDILSSVDLKQHSNGDTVRVGGVVVVHQAPLTAKGMHFITLEDEYGLLDIIVRPDVYEKYRKVLHQAGLLLVAGVVQRRDGVINVLAQQMKHLF